MNTLLPFADFERSAAVLDRQLLGIQRKDCLELIQALSGWKLKTRMKIFNPMRGMRTVELPRREWELREDIVGYTNHPCKKMWVGYEGLLRDYQYWITTEWVSRGYKDTCWEKFNVVWNRAYEEDPDEGTPSWLGDSMFHLSYQSLLISKDPAFYSELFPGAPEELKFKFPV